MSESSSVRWHILGLLFVASFVAYLLRLNLSVAAELMMPDLGLTEIQTGWVLSAFVWGYALFQFPGGIFGEVAGPRRALTVAALLWVVLTLLTGFVPGRFATSTASIMVALLALRFLMGVAQAPLFPITAGTIREWFPTAGWAFPNGLLSTGLSLGAAATPPLVAWAMVRLGWQESFYIAAPVALLTTAAWWWYATDTPEEHPRVEPGELELIHSARPAPASRHEQRRAWMRLLKNRDILMLSVSYLSMNYVFYLFFSWLYIYLVDQRGFGILEGGFFASAPFIVGAVGAGAGGWTCDRLCERIGPRWGCRIPSIVGLLLVALFLFIAATVESPYLAVVFLSLCFGCTQFTEGAYWSAATFVAGPHTAAATGILNTGGNLGGVISTPLAPLLAARFGWVGALVSGCFFAVFGALLWLWIRADRSLLEE